MREFRPISNRQVEFQSTPPVAGGRCNSASCVVTMEGRFQSTPPVAGGRCFLGRQAAVAGQFVSIHAPRCRGAMHGKARQ